MDLVNCHRNWSGQPHAFYYYKARVYRADIGRFLQVDPIGYDDQWNLYAYVGADPVNLTDPAGTGVDPPVHGCGSRTPYDSAGCLGNVTMGVFYIRGARQSSAPTGGNSGSPSAGRRLIKSLLKDDSVRKAMAEAWRRSRGDGQTRNKHEHGFWIMKKGSDYIAGRIIQGDRASIERTEIARAREEMPGADIFFHTHPFRTGEWIGVESVEISFADERVAKSFSSTIISLGRREPYTGRDWVMDYFFSPRN